MNFFESLFAQSNTVVTVSSEPWQYLTAIGVALVLGFVLALCYMKTGSYTKNFAMTVVLLPPVVAVVIMLASGSLGIALSVAGAFSLVRFRSVPGNSREIVSIFFSMAVGLACGLGFVFLATLVTVVLGAVFVALAMSPFGNGKKNYRSLKILIPESLNYTEVFDDIFRQYTTSCVLQRVKTTNMGSMYELRYAVHLKNTAEEKDMIDAIRTRNGNLLVMSSIERYESQEL